MNQGRSPQRRDRRLSGPGNPVLRGNVSTAVFNSTGNAPIIGRLPIPKYGGNKRSVSPARPLSRMNLKIHPDPPRFPYAGTYFDLNVQVVDALGNAQRIDGLKLGLSTISAWPCKVEVNHLSSPHKPTAGLYSMRVKILDDPSKREGRKLCLKVQAEGARNIMPAVTDHLTVVRCGLKITEALGHKIADRLVADALKGPRHIELKVHLVKTTGDRVRNRKVPLRVGIDYENRWTRNPGNACRILGLTGANAINDRGEVTLRVPFAEICKDWPSPPFSRELRLIVEPDLKCSDVGPAVTKRITVITTGATKLKPRRSRTTIRFKPLSFTRKLVNFGHPEPQNVAGHGTGRSDPAARNEKIVKRSHSFDSNSYARPWAKHGGMLLAPSSFDVTKGNREQTDGGQSIRKPEVAKTPDVAGQQSAALREGSEVVAPDPSMRRRSSTDVESVLHRVEEGALRGRTSVGGGDEIKGDDKEVDDSRRSSKVRVPVEARGLRTKPEKSRPAVFPGSRHDIRLTSDSVSGELGGGAAAFPLPRVGVRSGTVDNDIGATPASEDDVFYVVTTCYSSRRREMLGYPCFDRSQVLIGFYDEVRTRRGRCQMVFNSLQRVSSLDDKDRGATKAMMFAAMARGNPSVITRDDYDGSVEEMKKTALSLSRRRMSTKLIVTDSDDSDDSDHGSGGLQEPQSPTNRRWKNSSFRRNPSVDSYMLPWSTAADTQPTPSSETPTTVAMSTIFSNNALESIRELTDQNQSEAGDNDEGSRDTRLSPPREYIGGVSLPSDSRRDAVQRLDRDMSGGREEAPQEREANEGASGVAHRERGSGADPGSEVVTAPSHRIPGSDGDRGKRSASGVEAISRATAVVSTYDDKEHGFPEDGEDEVDSLDGGSPEDPRISTAVETYRSDKEYSAERKTSTGVKIYDSDDEGCSDERKISGAIDSYDSDDSDRGTGGMLDMPSPLHRRWKHSSFKRNPSLDLFDAPWSETPTTTAASSFKRLDSIAESADQAKSEVSDDIPARTDSPGFGETTARGGSASTSPTSQHPTTYSMFASHVDTGGSFRAVTEDRSLLRSEEGKEDRRYVRDGDDSSGIDRASEVGGLFHPPEGSPNAYYLRRGSTSQHPESASGETGSALDRVNGENHRETAKRHAIVNIAENAGDDREESGGEPKLEGYDTIMGRHCVAAR